jgi:hypothetical protein
MATAIAQPSSTPSSSAKLNGLDPEAHLARVLDCLARGHPNVITHPLRQGKRMKSGWQIRPLTGTRSRW